MRDSTWHCNTTDKKWCTGTTVRNRGKRILIQITFDVMNVRKPLLSTSALKQRGVTIIFNLDFDRIIVRNETVNLRSHDCHSFLLARHFDEGNSSLQSVGDGSTECDK